MFKFQHLIILEKTCLHFCKFFWRLCELSHFICLHILTSVTSNENWDNLLTMINTHTKYDNCHDYPSWDIIVYKVYTFWPFMISHDLWQPPKAIGIIFSIWPTHRPRMRLVKVTLPEISCWNAWHHIHITIASQWFLLPSAKNQSLKLLSWQNSVRITIIMRKPFEIKKEHRGNDDTKSKSRGAVNWPNKYSPPMPWYLYSWGIILTTCLH